MSAALTAEGLNTFYGKSHILRRGSGHGPARPQRRRQDHDAAQPDGVTPPREGRVSVFGRATTRWPPLRWAQSLARRHPRGQSGRSPAWTGSPPRLRAIVASSGLGVVTVVHRRGHCLPCMRRQNWLG
jgi:hypothetical protein